MPDCDENYKPEVCHAALDQAYQTKQYHDFIWDLIEEIPIITLWDACFGFARVLAYSGSVPECIKDADLDSLYQLSKPNISDSELLKPIQEWLSDQLIKSICKKEIEPSLVGRFVDGAIDPKRTFVDSSQITDWLVCRGINIEEGSGYELFTWEAASYTEFIYQAILRASQLLASKAYDPDFEISNNDTRENDYLFFENARLRLQIEQLPKQSQFTKKKTHANAERFAKNREQVLGAALNVISHWPEQCQNGAGKYEATKIAKMIDEKSLMFWPQTGEPPLSLDKMEREISKWINSTVK
ncbi:hypothetical protein [Methylobacter sp. BBA5.1]|uniref:hypothetical protein n=1 Tax=Methylobacter sp. BBA5.1 TaxID=1495064 RepID=UPI000A6B2F0C|nr:hypothetical protein [Methylobacter sp. BBA5.1]